MNVVTKTIVSSDKLIFKKFLYTSQVIKTIKKEINNICSF